MSGINIDWGQSVRVLVCCVDADVRQRGSSSGPALVWSTQQHSVHHPQPSTGSSATCPCPSASLGAITRTATSARSGSRSSSSSRTSSGGSTVRRASAYLQAPTGVRDVIASRGDVTAASDDVTSTTTTSDSFVLEPLARFTVSAARGIYGRTIDC